MNTIPSDRLVPPGTASWAQYWPYTGVPGSRPLEAMQVASKAKELRGLVAPAVGLRRPAVGQVRVRARVLASGFRSMDAGLGPAHPDPSWTRERNPDLPRRVRCARNR